jgi:hypothetical protein
MARATVEERFMRGLVQRPSGCLEWTKCTSAKGYGKIDVAGVTVLAHRLAWRFAYGPILDGLFVCHRCDNPPCCQTDPTEGYPEGHLFLGTNVQNMADMVSKGRHLHVPRGQLEKERTHCPRGHPYSVSNTYKHGNHRYCRECKRMSQARQYRLRSGWAED